MTSAYNPLNNKQVNDLSIGLCPVCNARLTAECEHRTQESEEWLAAYIVAELEIHNERRPFDRDDAAILQAARAIFPNAVFVESEMSLIDRVHMVHGEAPEPRTVNTLQALADTQDRQFNRRYYGNKKGLPFFER